MQARDSARDDQLLDLLGAFEEVVDLRSRRPLPPQRLTALVGLRLRWLPRVELRAIFEVLIPRVSRFELARPAVRARSSFLNAIKELPLRVA